MRYRKKPVVIEAFQFTGDNPLDVMQWVERLDLGGTRKINFTNQGAEIETMEGVMLARTGDWVICGVKGELYPCKPDIFEQTYEAVPKEGEE